MQARTKKPALKPAAAEQPARGVRDAGPLSETLNERPAVRLQRKLDDSLNRRNGLPEGLRNGIEQLSGLPMDGVEVHKNSPRPAQLNALAYTQENEVHVGPGQEKHLPHEAWHLVQQMQGRVRPTMQARGVAINDDPALEKEADVMGSRAAHLSSEAPAPVQRVTRPMTFRAVAQRVLDPADLTLKQLGRVANHHVQFGLVAWGVGSDVFLRFQAGNRDEDMNHNHLHLYSATFLTSADKVTIAGHAVWQKNPYKSEQFTITATRNDDDEWDVTHTKTSSEEDIVDAIPLLKDLLGEVLNGKVEVPEEEEEKKEAPAKGKKKGAGK